MKKQESKNDKIWNEKFLLCFEYLQKHGNLLIPQNYIIENIKLGSWISVQRYLYKKGKLSADRIEKLNSIGMVWSDYDLAWETNFNLAKKYYREHGNLSIEQSYCVAGKKLGNWIVMQRVLYKQGKLSEVQIQMLNSIGMVWDKYDSIWQSYYELAKTFYNENSNLVIPHDYIINGKNLGNWISSQRKLYKKGRLSSEKIDMLNALKMVWNHNYEAWDSNYRLAKRYYRQHYNLEVPEDYEVNGKKLCNWINKQRLLRSQGKLSTEKIMKLNAIGMSWNKRDDVWESNYDLAEKYFRQHGNLLLQQNYVSENMSLGRWVSSQRKSYLSNNLSDEKVKKLFKIGFEYDLSKTKYAPRIEKMFDKMGNDSVYNFLSNVCSTYFLLNFLLCINYDYVIENNLKSKIPEIDNELKIRLEKETYIVFILYLMGFSLGKMAKLYNTDIAEIEKMRLHSYRTLLEIIKIDTKKLTLV